MNKPIKMLMLAMALLAASLAMGKTEVLMFFDTEDFTSDRANDAIYDLAKLCTEEGVRAQFAIVGYLAHEIMRYDRRDVIAAMKPHVIGTQSLFHSVHPNIMEKSDSPDFQFSYGSVYADEFIGKQWIEEMMPGAPLMCAVPPGNSKSYVAMYAYADMGIPFFCDTVVDDGKDGDHSYCNIWQIPYYYDFTPEMMHVERCNGEPKFDQAIAGMAARKRVVLFMHPNSAIFPEFWDSINYNRGNFAEFGKWRIAKERSEADRELYYTRLRTLFRKLKADSRFEFVDLDQLAARRVPRQEIVISEAPALLEHLRCGLRCTRQPSRSVADIFQAAVRFLRGERVSPPAKVYGFLERPVGVTAPVEVSAADLRAAAAKIDLKTFLPATIKVGAATVGPADFLLAALEVVATGAERVKILPREQLGDLDEFPALRDFHPRGEWVLTPGFKDEYASDRLRWQFWTLRYND